MKPVLQTVCDAERGNCLSACLASILELALEEVPNFAGARPGMFWIQVNHWLQKRGLRALIVLPKHVVMDAGALYIANGVSPRGVRHSVVCEDGRMIHDPHPEGGGVVDVTEFVYLVVARKVRTRRPKRRR